MVRASNPTPWVTYRQKPARGASGTCWAFFNTNEESWAWTT